MCGFLVVISMNFRHLADTFINVLALLVPCCTSQAKHIPNTAGSPQKGSVRAIIFLVCEDCVVTWYMRRWNQDVWGICDVSTPLIGHIFEESFVYWWAQQLFFICDYMMHTILFKTLGSVRLFSRHNYLYSNSRFIKFIKSYSKCIYNATKYFFFKNAAHLSFLFIKESWKKNCITVSTKILSSTTITTVKIDNNKKCFLSTKSAY